MQHPGTAGHVLRGTPQHPGQPGRPPDTRPVPSCRESFFEKVGVDPEDAATWEQLGAFCLEFSVVLAQVHQFLESSGLDDPAKV